MTATARIPEFEDIDVERAQVRITNAGDGLSEALRVAPKALHLDQTVYYVLRGTVTQVNHRLDTKDDTVIRVHTVKADAITEVDGDTAKKMLAAAAKDLEERKAAMDGQQLLDLEHEAEAREALDGNDDDEGSEDEAADAEPADGGDE